MTAMNSRISRGGLIARIGWAMSDSLMVMQRNLLHLRYKPEEVIGSLAFPIVSVLLFGYVFGSAMAVPGKEITESS